MRSCWLIEFKDGYKIIISEELYKEENERNFGGREVLVEQHWFDYETCKKRNQGVVAFGIAGNKKSQPYFYNIGEPVLFNWKCAWHKGRVINGYRTHDGLINVQLDSGLKVLIGEARHEEFVKQA